MSRSGPLEGILVVSVEQAVAAPLATRHLADLGARVIKVERPEGGDLARSYDEVVGGTSAFFVWCNRGKDSVVLDLKSSDGKHALACLLDEADVFVSNLAPGALTRLGFQASQLRATHPELVVCEISGYGEGGPFDTRKAYDLIVQAEAGAFDVTGEGAERMRIGISIADIAAGMYAYSGILAALLDRFRRGIGAQIHISMLDALAEWMSVPLMHTAHLGRPATRSGSRHPTIAPYGLFTVGQRELLIAVQSDRDWASFCTAVDHDGLAADGRFRSNQDRVRNVDALYAVLVPLLRELDPDELQQRFLTLGVAFGVVNTMQDVRDHAQLAARSRWATTQYAGTVVDVPKPPISLDDFAVEMGDVPVLGQHTAAVLAEFVAPRGLVPDIEHA